MSLTRCNRFVRQFLALDIPSYRVADILADLRTKAEANSKGWLRFSHMASIDEDERCPGRVDIFASVVHPLASERTLSLISDGKR